TSCGTNTKVIPTTRIVAPAPMRPNPQADSNNRPARSALQTDLRSALQIMAGLKLPGASVRARHRPARNTGNNISVATPCHVSRYPYPRYARKLRNPQLPDIASVHQAQAAGFKPELGQPPVGNA